APNSTTAATNSTTTALNSTTTALSSTTTALSSTTTALSSTTTAPSSTTTTPSSTTTVPSSTTTTPKRPRPRETRPLGPARPLTLAFISGGRAAKLDDGASNLRRARRHLRRTTRGALARPSSSTLWSVRRRRAEIDGPRGVDWRRSRQDDAHHPRHRGRQAD